MPVKRTGIILAYDKSACLEPDLELLDEILPYIDVIKVGYEAMTSRDQLGAHHTVAELVASHAHHVCRKKTMWDGKFDDIGNTVDKAIRNVLHDRENIQFVTVHASMSEGALNLANVACAQANAVALAVTVLTDIPGKECIEMYGRDPHGQVAFFAARAKKCGLQGLVCSPKELHILKEFHLDDMIKVVPGIRPAWASPNDQKRVMTPAEAAKAGANYVVIGRPILEPPHGMTPLDAVRRIRDELENAVAHA